MATKKTCPACGAKMVQYPFKFNKGLASCLRKMAPYRDQEVEIKHLKLTTSQWTNFQKLRYWGFIEPVTKSDNVRKGGWWILTDRGDKFLRGKISISRTVWMYRNNFLKYEGPEIFITNVIDNYEYRPDYAENSRSIDDRNV